MKMIKIVRCTDPMLWYADKVGELVPFLGTWPEAFKSKEDAGYVNIVKFEDGVVVDIENQNYL